MALVATEQCMQLTLYTELNSPCPISASSWNSCLYLDILLSLRTNFLGLEPELELESLLSVLSSSIPATLSSTDFFVSFSLCELRGWWLCWIDELCLRG